MGDLYFFISYLGCAYNNSIMYENLYLKIDMDIFTGNISLYVGNITGRIEKCIDLR